MRGFAKRSGRVLAAGVIMLQLFGGFVVGVQQIMVERAAAQACATPTLNRCEQEGYFTGRQLNYSSPGDPAPPGSCIVPPYGFVCGIWQNTDYLGVGDVTQFVAVTSTNLNLNFDACRGTAVMGSWATLDTDWDQPANACFKNKARATHAAFLVWSMMGRNGTDFGSTPDSNYTGVQFAKLAFAQWANLVNWYAANGLANFNAFIAPSCAGGATQTFNVIRYGQDVGYVLSPGCAPPADTILFSIPGGGTFEINKSCANVKGPITPLAQNFNITPFAQTPTLTPNDSPTRADFQASIQVDRRAGPITVTRQYFLRRGGAATELPAFATFTSSNTYDPGTYPFAYTQNGIPGVTIGDQVCQRITVSPAVGTADPSGVIASQVLPSQSSEACERFLHKPYSKVFGGDVSAGAGFGVGCPVDPEAGLVGFNRLDPTTLGNSGAGTQLAAMALGQILDYSSSQIVTPANSKSLSFANAGGGYASSAFGGDLNAASAVCAPDYFAEATGVLTGDVVIAGRTLLAGQRQTIYVDGNAFIANDINYGPANYADPSQIPSFRLIVRGNIYVRPDVDNLSGLFVAQPNPASPATTGRFYTCGAQEWVGNPGRFLPDPAQTNIPCNSNLTVYGAVAADMIKLLRSPGTISQSNVGERYNTAYGFEEGPAERFIFSPEMWLNGAIPAGGGSYDSINVLPPIL